MRNENEVQLINELANLAQDTIYKTEKVCHKCGIAYNYDKETQTVTLISDNGISLNSAKKMLTETLNEIVTIVSE